MAPGKKLPTKLVSIRVHWWLALPWQPKGRAACHERNGSRESARAAELSRRLADCLARFLASHRLGDPARAAAGDFAIRAGLPSRDGPKPDRGLVAETSFPRFVSVILLMLALVAITTTIIVFAI